MRAIKVLAGAGVVALVWFGFDNSPPAAQAADDPPPSFAKDVKPFLTNYCQNCHAGRRAKAGFSVDTYANLLKKGRRGALVVPNEPDDSRMYLTLIGRAKRMPPKNSDQPTADEVAKIKAWIKAGAKDDSTGGEKKVGGEE